MQALLKKKDWDPETWDGNIWDSSESESDNDTIEYDAKGEAQPIVEQRYTGPNSNNLQDATAIRGFKTQEMQEMATRFHQQPWEDLLEWLLCLWNDGTDLVHFTKEELDHLGSIAQDPMLWNMLQNMQVQDNAFPSLMEWILRGSNWPGLWWLTLMMVSPNGPLLSQALISCDN